MPEPLPVVAPAAAAPAPAAAAPAPAPATPVIPAASATPAPAAAAPATPAAETLLGKDPEAKVAEPVVETAEQKAAKEAVVAEEKRLLEADEKTLSAEDLAKKKEIVKAKETAAGKVVPDKYTLKPPEGMTVDQDFLDNKMAPVLKECGVTQENFQKIIDVYAPHLQEQQKQAILTQQTEAINGFKAIVKEWGVEAQKMLGAKPAEAMAPAARAINKLSSDPKAFRSLLEETGVGNHKLLVEVLIKAGKLLGEDPFPGGAPAPGEATSDGAAKRLFPTSTA